MKPFINCEKNCIDAVYTAGFLCYIVSAISCAVLRAAFMHFQAARRAAQQTGGFIDYGKKNEVHGRQQRCRARIVRVQRGRGDLPDHPVVPDGGPGRPVVGERAEEHLRHAGQGRGDAVRGRRRRRGARLPRRRRADDDLHGVPGPAAHDPEHVQDRGRAAPQRVPRLRPYRLHPRAEHLRRPQRRHGMSADRLRHAVRKQRAGGHGPLSRRPPRRADRQGAVHQLLRRLPHLSRDPEGRGVGL